MSEVDKAVIALDGYMDQLEAALVDGNVADAMVLVMEMNDILVWLKARVREDKS